MRALFTALIFLTCAAAPAAAQDCPRGTLDARYCDRDSDLLADTPRETEQWRDPKTLIFSYTPLEDPAVWESIWQPFIAYLSKVTGRPARFFQVQSYAAQLEALRSGRLHVASVNSGSVPIAVNCAGFVPALTMATPEGPVAYTMNFITPANSPVSTPADLKGKTIGFVSPTSNSGFKAPTMILKDEFGMVLERDYTARYTGKHDTSIIGVAAGDFEAAAVAGELANRMAERGIIDLAKIKVIYTSPPFPSQALGYIHDLHPDLARKVREAFLTYDWNDPPLQKEFPGVNAFKPLDYKADYDLIRKVDASAGVTYDCR